MGESFDISSAYLCLIVLGCGRLVSFITYPFGSLLLTVKRHDITAKVSVLETVCSAILCIILIPKYELLGAAIAIALPLMFGRVFLISVYAAKFVQIDWINVIARVLLYAAISALIGWYTRDLVGTVSSYLGMLSNLVIYEFCLFVIGLFVLFKFDELLQIKNKVVQFVAKKSVIGK
jgi:O-antigen/teichoic acid export membrane protein